MVGQRAWAARALSPREVPDAGAFQAPLAGSLGTYEVTLHNRCAQTVWPAWASMGGLDNTVVDTQLWLPMSPASDRAITVYGGLRDIEFWGRTGCSFDQAGSGACQTGDCGGFACNKDPLSTTVFVLKQGFVGGYNLGLRVEGPTCGEHECVETSARAHMRLSSRTFVEERSPAATSAVTPQRSAAAGWVRGAAANHRRVTHRAPAIS